MKSLKLIGLLAGRSTVRRLQVAFRLGMTLSLRGGFRAAPAGAKLIRAGE